MGEDVETLKRRLPLIEYLRRITGRAHLWAAPRSSTLSVARGDPTLVLCRRVRMFSIAMAAGKTET